MGACALRRPGRVCAAPVFRGPRSCGRSWRPHRGNRSAAAAQPCRPQDCHRFGCEGTLVGSPEVAFPDSQTPPSSPQRYRRRHARRGRQIPQKVTTRPRPEQVLRRFPADVGCHWTELEERRGGVQGRRKKGGGVMGGMKDAALRGARSLIHLGLAGP